MGKIERAYGIAMGIEKPFMRLCADIATGLPMPEELYKELERHAGVKTPDGNRLFILGSYASPFEPDARKHLAAKKFAYSEMAVDGVHRDGRLNLALWLQRKDLEKITPKSFTDTFEGDIDIMVLERYGRLEDVPANARDLDPALHLGMKTPMIAKLLFGDSPFTGGNYSLLPPHVVHFYGGETTPPEYAGLLRAMQDGTIGVRIKFGK